MWFGRVLLACHVRLLTSTCCVRPLAQCRQPLNLWCAARGRPGAGGRQQPCIAPGTVLPGELLPWGEYQWQACSLYLPVTECRALGENQPVWFLKLWKKKARRELETLLNPYPYKSRPIMPVSSLTEVYVSRFYKNLHWFPWPFLAVYSSGAPSLLVNFFLIWIFHSVA